MLKFSRLSAPGLCFPLIAFTLAAAVPGPLPAGERHAEQFLIVDCLLPGQVRRLGRQATYMTARRAMRTTASDCEIRGGEYTAFDRANYATALKIWLPLAQGGDAKAQNYVGEIYEKGLGTEPQYDLAAAWYLKAAEQGLASAQINLGALHEQGLGVPLDKARAVAWYRRASGLEQLNLAYVPAGSGTSFEELASERDALALERDALRGELNALEDELRRAGDRHRRQQAETRAALAELEAATAELERQRREAARTGDEPTVADLAKLADLEKALADKEAEVRSRQLEQARLDARVAELGGEVRRLDAALAGAREEAEIARDELQQQRRLLAERERELDVLHDADLDGRREVAEIRAQLERERASAEGNADRVRALELRLAAGESELQARDERIAGLQRQVDDLRSELEEIEAPVDTALQAHAQAHAQPSIEIIEPVVESTRTAGDPVIAVDAAGERVVVGRVKAPAGLLTLMINDAEHAAVDGIFRVAVGVSHPETPVRIVAIDNLGQRSALSFVLQPQDRVEAPVETPAVRPAIADVHFGRFHALVIGNNEYQHLRNLETAVNDARAVDEVLRTRYAFQTTLLINADRYTILSTLNRLREQLDENTNLLIYYAGHGELDRVNDRGHWLPVDAERGSSANWISNIQITDILNAMTVRQVMVVADSCYSGSLTRASLAQLDPGMSDQARVEWVSLMAGKRARVVLTSGGVQPVIDRGGRGNHSVFASAFLDVLGANADVLEGQRLYMSVSERMAGSVATRVGQTPQYAPIRFAGHESGDFFFVPAS